MIIDILRTLRLWKIVLGSASPRRLEIMRQVGLYPVVKPSDFAEDLDKAIFATPESYVTETARQKAIDVCKSIVSSGDAIDVIIASDSVVVCGDRILEKPKTRSECVDMMTLLAGRTHRVLSALAVATTKAGVLPAMEAVTQSSIEHGSQRFQLMLACISTEVTFAPLSSSMIEEYANGTDAYDKAGGYGIQSVAAQFISGINGDYYNVMGLPICQLCKILRVIHDANPEPPTAASASS